jgi:hypothetical protein
VIDDFYIGYETPVPRQSRRLLFSVIALLFVLAVGLGGLLVAYQAPFADVVFAFGQREAFTGIVRIDPDPALETPGERVLLVGAGKHGATDVVRAFEGQPVRLEGALIRRGAQRMVEVAAASLTPVAKAMLESPNSKVTSFGEATLDGEIVDGKCFLGVMNPGEGTVHRDCARACLRGGLPPLFVVRTAGELVTMALVSVEGRPMGERVASWAGRPVSITGQVQLREPGHRWVLTVDPRTIKAR